MSEDPVPYGDPRPVVSAQTDLQAEIEALAAFPDKPASEWVARVQSAPYEVIAGAMLMWRGPPSGGFSTVPGDPYVIRRGAAQAIIQARLSSELGTFSTSSGRQADKMIGLTWAIVALTATMLAAVGAQIYLTVKYAPADPGSHWSSN